MTIRLQPNPGAQELALRIPVTVTEVLYGGARGGGKTWSGLMWLLEYVHHPRFQGLVIRRNADDLSDWIERARYMYRDMGATPQGATALMRFPSGAIIRTGHLKDESTYTKYLGHEYQKILIEELTQIPTEDRYLKLISACRTSIPELVPQVFATTNPGGVGHLWVKQRFIDPSPPKKIFIGSDGTKRIYIPATVDDNPVLTKADPEYVKKLEALKDVDEALYRAWRFGDWDVFQGQVFREWRVAKHVKPNFSFDTSACKIYIGLDWGFHDPCSVHWIAVTPENEFGVQHFIVYRERYENEQRPDWWAKEIAEIVRDEKIDGLIMPHDTFSNLGGTRPIVEQFRAMFDNLHVHVPIIGSSSKSHASKMSRIAITHNGLADSPDGMPYLIVLDNCRNLIRTLPSLPYDEHKPEEIDDGAEDHAWDSLSYGLFHVTQGGTRLVSPRSPKSMSQNIKQADFFDLEAAIRDNSGKVRAREWRYT